MALNQKALQKKRAKRGEKRSQVKKSRTGLGALWGVAREWGAASRAPVADVLVPSNLFELGIGNVWFSRRLPDGRYAVAGFLLDVFCLGVKNAMYKIMEANEYALAVEHIHGSAEERFDHQHPAYARKLVEEALAYARDLGFEPHPDYKMAKIIFGDIDAATCPASFVFGSDSKPFYVCGPHDSPSMQGRIVKQLEKRCGVGGFHYMVGVTADAKEPFG